MIITLTLNPAIDRTVNINDFEINKVNRVFKSRDDAAGKGINVSKVIKVLGSNSIALGIIGGHTGEFIESYLSESGIKNHFYKVKGDTRINLKVIDEKNRTHTDINQMGPEISKDDLFKLKKYILDYASSENIFVIAGSVPRGVGKNIYQELIREINAKGGKVILDADGDLFLNGIEEAPFMVKPNIHELEDAFEMRIDNKKDLMAAAGKVLDKGVEVIAVSLGHEGSMYITKEDSYWAKGLEVEVKSTVGAGDSMVAALSVALERGLDGKEAIKLAAATSTANVMTEGTQTGDYSEIERLMELVIVKETDKDEE